VRPGRAAPALRWVRDLPRGPENGVVRHRSIDSIVRLLSVVE